MSEPDSAAATGSHENSHASPAVNPHSFLGMPSEIQKDIIKHCCQHDLICLALVSKHCRELAASQLYRQFHIVFPDEDDPSFDSQGIDGLAGGLDTFVTSDYDYAKHLKDLSLDTLSAGSKGEAAYKPYLFNTSCGKFMNTLLLLTLRKANKLETFKWNIRVELSRPVYAALHDIKTIANIHIRMQAGPSLYEKPPPLPHAVHPPPVFAPGQPPVHWMPQGTHPPPVPPQQGIDLGSQITTANSTFMPVYFVQGSLVQSQQPPHPHTFAQQPPHPQAFPQQPPHHQPPAPKPPSKTKAQKRPHVLPEPPTLSGFKNLKSLAVLDIDTLDIVTEIKTCVRNSAGTLTKLKLSFSDFLASQARKPPAPEVVTDDSDEEELSVWSNPGVAPNPQPSSAVESSGAKAHRAQEEKKTQESVLGRIFDVEHYVVKKPQKVKSKEKTPAEALSSDPGQNFIKNVMKAAEVLMKEKGDMRREALDMIETAASAYVASLKTKENGTTSASSESQSAQTKVEAEGEPNTAGLGSGSMGSSVPTRQKKEGDDFSPEDINIEDPEGELELDPGSPGPKIEDTETVPESSPSQSLSLATGGLDPASVKKAVANLVAQKVNYQTLIKKLEIFEARANDLRKETEELREQDGPIDRERIARTEKEITELSNGIEKARSEINVVEAEVADSQKEIYGLRNSDTIESQRQRRSEYARATRGLPLQSLSIYLVPVKPSVLAKGVDIRMLTRITLLNVGPQAPIWAYFKSQNEENPLPLCKIFTDNITESFLQFISQLNQVTELFLLERDAKYKPESFATKTKTVIDEIRRLALRKHMPHLRKLMIKNLASKAWDLNAEAIKLLCKRGKNLEELACSMSMRCLHTFNQNARLLINLHALHIISLRCDDPCPSLSQEAKKFLIDSLSQHPSRKLEWISINDGDGVDHIKFRKPPSAEERKRRMAAKKAKGKAKATVTTTSNGTSNNTTQYPTFPPPEIWDGESSADDSYADEELKTFIPFERLGTMRFYDVEGVRIFKKEVVSGRL
ncbi:hypothetical protein B0H65DRAFT_552798 [Neurospora tetraspora]|uniref:F-box domain-containing protein n=1 Tax=Neurospora tetraspora TaxID=94610 RepID=A0AAE0MN80_9PEZI|nr:hypothetical protein B0H65DRAFT_552798 [Neurospora tetraspora]